MQVWFVRHALAAERDTFTGSDEERPLVDKGRRQFRAVARWLIEQKHAPDLVVSSPLVRAVETGQLLCKAAGLKKKDLLLSDLLSPGINIDKLMHFLREQTAETVALVGHEPDMSSCTSRLVGGGQYDFGKGNVACIEFSGPPGFDNGELAWFVGPKLIG